MSSPTEIVAFLAENDVPFVDCRFSDILGREHHLTIPADRFDEDTIEGGIPFDGSFMTGWKGVEASDMLLVPDLRGCGLNLFETIVRWHVLVRWLVSLTSMATIGILEYWRTVRRHTRRV